MGDLAAFFREKHKQTQQWKKERQKILEEWQKVLHDLFQQLREWLRPAEEEGLQIRTSTMEVHEELLGTYKVPALELSFGTIRVRIVPRARLIVGGAGRVEIESSRGNVALVRTQPDSEWFLSYEGRLIPLTQGTFTDLIQELFA